MFPVQYGPTAESAFYHIPKWTGEYGEARKRLLTFMIKQLQSELNETV